MRKLSFLLKNITWEFGLLLVHLPFVSSFIIHNYTAYQIIALIDGRDFVVRAFPRYSFSQNLDGALDQYLIAIKIRPKLGAAHYNIACIYSLRDQKMLAIESLIRAVGLNKKFARMARTDRDFLNISNSEEFQNTIKLDN